METTPAPAPVEPPKVVDVTPPKPVATTTSPVPDSEVPKPAEPAALSSTPAAKPPKQANPAIIPVIVAVVVCLALATLAYMSYAKG